MSDLLARAVLFCSIPHVSLVECAGSRGFKGVVIDDEKFHVSPETASLLCLAAEKWEMEALMRLRVGTAERLEYALSLGLTGVLLPRLTSVAQVEELIAATRYVPHGTRGLGSSRATAFGRRGDAVDIQVIIETPELLECVEDVARMDGVTGIDIGLLDLTAALGLPRDLENDDVRATVLRVIDVAHAQDKPVTMAMPDVRTAKGWTALGLDTFVLEPLGLIAQALDL
jgi:2-keto-3-deoxy-L-rhamnonate aldolase RhmA